MWTNEDNAFKEDRNKRRRIDDPDNYEPKGFKCGKKGHIHKTMIECIECMGRK